MNNINNNYNSNPGKMSVSNDDVNEKSKVLSNYNSSYQNNRYDPLLSKFSINEDEESNLYDDAKSIVDKKDVFKLPNINQISFQRDFNNDSQLKGRDSIREDYD